MTGLEVRRQEQDRLRVRVVRRRPVVPTPEKMSEPRGRGADVRMAVVTVDPPRLQDAVGVAVLAGTADVIHDLVTPILENGFSDSRRDVVERLVP